MKSKGEIFKDGTARFLTAVLDVLRQQRNDIAAEFDAALSALSGDGAVKRATRATLEEQKATVLAPVDADITNIQHISAAMAAMTDEEATKILGDESVAAIQMGIDVWIGEKKRQSVDELVLAASTLEEEIRVKQANLQNLISQRGDVDTQWGGLVQFWRTIPDAIRLKIASDEIMPEMVFQLFARAQQPRDMVAGAGASRQIGLSAAVVHEMRR